MTVMWRKQVTQNNEEIQSFFSVQIKQINEHAKQESYFYNGIRKRENKTNHKKLFIFFI